jgi:hypothetical protein
VNAPLHWGYRDESFNIDFGLFSAINRQDPRSMALSRDTHARAVNFFRGKNATVMVFSQVLVKVEQPTDRVVR